MVSSCLANTFWVRVIPYMLNVEKCVLLDVWQAGKETGRYSIDWKCALET